MQFDTTSKLKKAREIAKLHWEDIFQWKSNLKGDNMKSCLVIFFDPIVAREKDTFDNNIFNLGEFNEINLSIKGIFFQEKLYR